MNIPNLFVTILAASTIIASQTVTATSITTSAKLTQVQGDVMVNNGARFVKAVSGTELKPGAKIVTAKSSTISLSYQNGCVKQIKQNTMHTVGTPEQCAADAGKERIYVAALGDPPIPKLKQTLHIPAMVGGMIAAAVVFTNSGGNNNKNISAE